MSIDDLKKITCTPLVSGGREAEVGALVAFGSVAETGREVGPQQVVRAVQDSRELQSAANEYQAGDPKALSDGPTSAARHAGCAHRLPLTLAASGLFGHCLCTSRNIIL